jgi:hypothetical protein
MPASARGGWPRSCDLSVPGAKRNPGNQSHRFTPPGQPALSEVEGASPSPHLQLKPPILPNQLKVRAVRRDRRAPCARAVNAISASKCRVPPNLDFEIWEGTAAKSVIVPSESAPPAIPLHQRLEALQPRGFELRHAHPLRARLCSSDCRRSLRFPNFRNPHELIMRLCATPDKRSGLVSLLPET